MRRCPCFGCKLNRRSRTVKANGSHKQKNRLIDELMDMWLHESDDNNYNQAILDGSWPQSIEILERQLTKARLKRPENEPS